MNIYVGNLPYSTTEADLTEKFGAFGQVESASIIQDRVTGRSRGFGFVTMPNEDEAQKAIEGLNGEDFDGRALKVNQAKEKRTDGGGGGGGGGSDWR